MKLRSIKWRKDGYGTKFVGLPNNVCEDTLYKRGPQKTLRCAYWQIWFDDPQGRRVVDTALTYRKAVSRIKQRIALMEGA